MTCELPENKQDTCGTGLNPHQLCLGFMNLQPQYFIRGHLHAALPWNRPFPSPRLRVQCSRGIMAEEEASFQPKAVKDVPAEQFISAYAAHLKTNDKVRCWR
jgi:hypothetical protein